MGRYLKKLYTQLQSTYPEFEHDVTNEIARQDAALKMIELRLNSGLNQTDYADKTDIFQTRISLLESGEANPRLSTLIKLAEKNNCQLEIKFKKNK